MLLRRRWSRYGELRDRQFTARLIALLSLYAVRLVDGLLAPATELFGCRGHRCSAVAVGKAFVCGTIVMTCVLSVSFFSVFLSVPGDAQAEFFASAWGDDLIGELGNGEDYQRNFPYELSGVPVGVCALDSPEEPCPTGPYLGEIVYMSAGGGFSLAVLSGGKVVGWGGNLNGSLGVNTNGQDVPFGESFTSGVKTVATGNKFSMALLNNGTVDAFGDNNAGQLGNGTSGVERNWEPVQVRGLSGVTAIAAGWNHALALLSNGKVMAWGENNNGELGDGTTTNSDIPVEVSELGNVVAISAGNSFSLALLSNGAVKAWGTDNVGQLGDGATTNSDVPVTVSGLSGVTAISAGNEFSLALLGGGTVEAWGMNEDGELGDGTNRGPSVCGETPEVGSGHACSTIPVAVSSLSGAVAVSAGYSFGGALLSNHTVWEWGENQREQLGDDAPKGPQLCELRSKITEYCSTTPVEAVGIESVKGISSGEGFELAWGGKVPQPTWEEILGPYNPGEPNQQRACNGDPVSCATGNLTESQTDLTLSGRGIPLTLTRTYNAQAAVAQSSPGPFGYGWSSSFGDHLTISSVSGTVTVVQANGSVVTFKGSPGTTGEFIAPEWSQAKLSFSSEHLYVYTLPDQEVFKFSEQGLLLSETDHDGNTTSMAYNAADRLETVTDPAGRRLIFAYNIEGLVESVQDPMRHTTKYTYEGGNLASVIEPGESTPRWQFKYDASHRMTMMTDGRGGKTTNEYDSFNRVISQTDPANRTTTFEYAPFQTMIVNRATGEATKEVFTEGYEPETITRGYGSANATTEYFNYDEAGDLKSVIDGYGHKTQYGYDNAGNRTSVIDPAKDETKWTYDSTHNVLTMTTPDGETTTIKRGSHGNPETIERPAPGSTTQTTKYTYNSVGELESMTDPLERTWKYEYDNQGDRVAEIDPEGAKRTWEYNEDSQEVATISPRGNVTGGEPAKYTTQIERDAQGRPLAVTDPLGHKTKYTYDADGNLETQTDPNGHKTTYTYDADNERTKVEEPNSAITETGYDGAGQIISQTDGNKHTTKYVRNALEQVTEVVDPLGRKITKEYDAAGNLTGLTDAAKRITTYTYDAANRPTEIKYSDGKTHVVQYDYNGDGNRTAIVDGTGTTTDTYDQLDRLTEQKDGHGDVTKYEYDLANEQTKLVYPNGKAVEYTYDKAGRMASDKDWLGNTASFGYDPDSNLTTITFPSGTGEVDHATYNEAGQQTEVKMAKGTGTLASLVYTRDSDGQVTKTVSKGLPGAETAETSYDTNERLSKAGSAVYEYDTANNPTKVNTTVSTFNADDQLTEVTGVKYTYDELGERTKTTPSSGAVTTYGYDQSGNLISIERPKEGKTAGITDTYTYNGDALRASETISAKTAYLTWDTGRGPALLLSDGTNSYVYGPDDMPFEQINTKEEPTYLHHDQQGSTRLLTSSIGAVIGTYTYSPYGTTEAHTGIATIPLGYDGQYTSSDTGLVYLRARVYDPATAQFLSRDPLASLTGRPYVYAADNPVNGIDPSGYEAIPFPIEGPGVPACLTPETVAPCIIVGGGGYLITEGVKSMVNSWAGEEGGDEGEAELHEKELERENCGEISPNFNNPAESPGPGWEWHGNPDSPVGSNEGAWVNPETGATLHPDLSHGEPIGPHFDYRAPDGSEYRIYPNGRIEPKP